jgi:acyl-CoA thioester hydrolase
MPILPTIIRHSTVRPGWVDYNGHMGDYAYTIVFSEALAAFMDAIGLDAAHQRETGCTLRVSELRIAFLREFHEGDAFDVDLRVIDLQAGSVRLFGRMIDAASGADAALSDQLLIYVSSEGNGIGRAQDFPEALKLTLDELLASGRDELPSPWLKSRIGIRRKA